MRVELERLIEAVEAGQRPAREPEDIEDDCPVPARLLLRAFDGSLDAAKALHEAVLMGWSYEIRPGSVRVLHPEAYIRDRTDNSGDTPARCWLLAILRAKLVDAGR